MEKYKFYVIFLDQILIIFPVQVLIVMMDFTFPVWLLIVFTDFLNFFVWILIIVTDILNSLTQLLLVVIDSLNSPQFQVVELAKNK